MRSFWREFLVVVLALGVVSGLGAQTQSSPVVRAPDGDTWEHIDGIFMTPIAGVPFTGTVLMEATRVMEDGGTLTRHTFNQVARDSAGRVRLENRRMLPASVTSEPKLNYFILIDMAKRTRTQCYPAVKFCRVMTVRPGTHAPVLPAGPIGTNEYLERADLGHAQKAGQDATGTRETLTLRADAVGNNRPMISKKEIWYSPYLQVNVSVTRQSPKTGTDVLTVGDITLGEPVAALLQVPEGYKVVDEQLASDMADQPVAATPTR